MNVTIRKNVVTNEIEHLGNDNKWYIGLYGTEYKDNLSSLVNTSLRNVSNELQFYKDYNYSFTQFELTKNTFPLADRTITELIGEDAIITEISGAFVDPSQVVFSEQVE